MDIKYDIEKYGLEAFLEPWQVTSLQILWASNKPLKSRYVWELVNQKFEPTISRASIINFLEYLRISCVLEGIDQSGKGGHYYLYRARLNEPEFKLMIVNDIIKKLREFTPIN